ncbi:hypothetical protein Corgl_0917 [Coriobacterium glomerans PW2]|uniref:Uncharacterized protein n=1 Tax=Coriobacterium glomerans (strain ATCC 49209 / DSM 20642 / JCM 10262 / PW2) TaxID=700015 RepID=F2N9J9_CORGP|nr:hypothetical protein [Coriobacterium glomerans]AEB07028.1 hypothetical protein Corgl_0917 [Coriobacterium glomerans PW2]
MEDLVLKLRLRQDECPKRPYGWKPGMDEQEAWRAAQGDWRASRKRVAACERVIVLNPDSEVVCVVSISKVRKIAGSARIRISGSVQKRSPLLGRTMVVNWSRNPVAYR